MKKAIVAGHICIDITPVFPAETKRGLSLGELLRPGSLIHMDSPDVHPGGAVANTGLGMKKLGADPVLLGKIGDDAFGSMIRSILDRDGVGDELLVSPGETTSYSVVIAAPGVDRVFLHCPGANDTFDGSEISDELLRDAAIFHFGYPTQMKQMFSHGGRNLAALLRRVKEHGVATSLDLAALDPMSEAGQTDWTVILANTLPYVDFFVPSFEELCFMLDRPKLDSLQQEAGAQEVTEILQVERDIRPLAKRCLDMGARAVLLKCGAPGLFLLTSGHMEEVGEELALDPTFWNDFSAFEGSYRIESVLSGTGAGDTSIAAFLTSLLMGYGPGESLQHAAGAGALCCTAYDAVSGLLPLKEIRKRIDAGWAKRIPS